MENSLIQQLPNNSLDIVGDIHGEYLALKNLLNKLGYDETNGHPENRKLVFLGDFCDRGPNSPEVIFLVKKLVEKGIALAILGNHEINLLNNDPKDGSGWFFQERYQNDLNFYAPFSVVKKEDKEPIQNFLNLLPLALERDDLRIVHATWHTPSINKLRRYKLGDVTKLGIKFKNNLKTESNEIGLQEEYQKELSKWAKRLENENIQPPFLNSIVKYEQLEQKHNPIKLITSGIEEISETPFFSGNRWRFCDRVSWWNQYDDATPVVIGHYWRLYDPSMHQRLARYSLLFDQIEPLSWHGINKNVFCVDYSVGARWRDRLNKQKFRLAALRWPENHLVFENGEILNTTNYKKY